MSYNSALTAIVVMGLMFVYVKRSRNSRTETAYSIFLFICYLAMFSTVFGLIIILLAFLFHVLFDKQFGAIMSWLMILILFPAGHLAGIVISKPQAESKK